MLEAVSTTIGIWLGYAAMHGYARGGSAVSSEARAVRDAVCAVVALTERSQALFGDKAAAISHLRALANECAEPGWDSEGACTVSPPAVLLAEGFIRALPDSIPLPEFAPEPDGSISLDWIQSRNCLFSISVGSNNRLAYAWLDGADKGHAVARFDGDRIPPRIVEGIRAIVGHGNASLRAA
ncbi:MAG: hypothetical protein WCJ75_18265 [Desulfomonile sp.]